MRLLIMGPPGAGKGTQAELIAHHFEIPAISTGAMFRAEVAAETELGKRVEALMNAGKYVPDELTDEIVKSRLERRDTIHGFLLDGFPRTPAQVEALDEYLAEKGVVLDAVISLEVDGDALVERLLRRAQLEGRADDNEETIRNRMQIYREETAPLLKTYGDRGILVAVSGEGSIESVARSAFQAIVASHLPTLESVRASRDD